LINFLVRIFGEVICSGLPKNSLRRAFPNFANGNWRTAVCRMYELILERWLALSILMFMYLFG